MMRVVWCCLFLLMADRCLANQDPVDRLLSAIQWNRSSMCKFEYSFRRESPLLNEARMSTYSIQTLAVETKGQVVRLRPRGDDETILLRSEAVLRGDQMLYVSTNVSSATPHERKPEERIGLMLMSATLSDSPKHEAGKKQLLNRANYNLACGVSLGLPIEYYAGNRSDRQYTESNGRIECVVRTRFGTCTMAWSDPNAIYPAQVEIRASGRDVLYDTPVNEVVMHGSKGWPAGGLISVTSTISVIRTAKYRGHTVPTEWSCLDTYDCADGSTVVERCSVKLTDCVDAKETDAGKVGVDLPIGTRASVQGAHHLAYVWDGDWTVPELQLLAPPEAPSSNRRFLLTLASAAAISLCAALFFIRVRHSR